MLQASDYLFCPDLTEEYDYPTFCITSKNYWAEYRNLDDCLGSLDCLPKGFLNASESIWEYIGGTKEQGYQALLDAGLVYSKEMDEYINGNLDS